MAQQPSCEICHPLCQGVVHADTPRPLGRNVRPEEGIIDMVCSTFP